MAYALNNITAPDAVQPASTLYCQGSRRINIDVANAAIYYQLGTGQVGSAGGDPVWGPELYLTPSFRGLDRVCDGIRFRAAVVAAKLAAGQPQAQVTIHAFTAEEVGSG